MVHLDFNKDDAIYLEESDFVPERQAVGHIEPGCMVVYNCLSALYRALK